MPSRRALLPCLLACAAAWLAGGPSAARAAPAPLPPMAAWDVHEQRVAVHAGLLAPLADGLVHGERELTAPQLRAALAGLSASTGVAPAAVTSPTPPSVLSFDALLVRRLGLGDVAATVLAEARRAGLRPQPSFGTEVVARLAGLRHDHPYGADGLELYPTQAITRAEAAWSLAAVADWDGSQQQWVRDVLADFVLPDYSAAQLRVLRPAVAKVGMPYVWGGETDTASAAYGGQVHGGYDCSGFVWRTFKLTGNPLGRQITGRTAAGQAGEIPATTRVRLEDVEPADLVFFGPGRFDQRATEKRITHVGIALSGAFMLNSAGSYGGVGVAPLLADDGRDRHFSWARRVLR